MIRTAGAPSAGRAGTLFNGEGGLLEEKHAPGLAGAGV